MHLNLKTPSGTLGFQMILYSARTIFLNQPTASILSSRDRRMQFQVKISADDSATQRLDLETPQISMRYLGFSSIQIEKHFRK